MSPTQNDHTGMAAYLERKEAHRQRIAAACGAYQDAHPEALAELKADERRQAKREARHEAGKLSEHEEQCLLAQALEAANILYMAIPNGVCFSLKGRALFAYRAYLRAEGLALGAPDLVVDGGNGRALLVEMKAIGGRLSPEQDALHKAWREAGYRVIVGYGWRDAWVQIQAARG